MQPLVLIILLLVLLMVYFIVVIVTSRIEIEKTRVYHRRADENRKIVYDFYESVFNNKDLSAADKYLDENYIQHNPTVATGKQGFKASASELFKKYPSWKVEFKRTIAEGDLVVTHTLAITDAADPASKGNAVMDIFRVEKGVIMEHWDVIQEVPVKSENTNTMF